MKYIVIGLGNFGSTLSIRLTEMGSEVIGVDNSMAKVDSIKDRVTHAICLDCTEQAAINTLPLHDTDIVIVGIGEDFGASVMATALLKQHGVKRLISRAISPLHQTVLEAIGVETIVLPEQESAERLAKQLEMKGVINSFNLSEDYHIIEAAVPDRYVGKTIEEADFRGKYKLNILTIKKMKSTKNIFGFDRERATVVDIVTPQTVFEKGDIIVVFGKITDIDRLLGLE
ncbi:MAG TPA: TrkA family potassium uptake protein [Patescibacteria group bacterium]|nr:TrkA family potassium uptake protein [Patescibacteria group bacterium]